MVWTIATKIAFTALLLLIVKKYRFFYVLYKTFNRDFNALTTLFKVIPIYREVMSQNKPVHYYFKIIVKKYPQKAAFLFENEVWTFTDVNDLCNKITVFFKKEGYKKGESVALLLNNCPDYIAIWLGLTQMGIIVSLINTNLLSDSLLHSLKIGKCKSIIFGGNFNEVITNFVQKNSNLKCYQYNRKIENHGVVNNCVDLSKEISNINPNESTKYSYDVTASDPILYIYTSGTTGFPKAAIINHIKICSMQAFTATVISKPKDAIVYCPLPLYHGSGGIIGCSVAILWGATVVIRSKFSASNYWKDCVKYNCNAGQYIGEMCRYILHNSSEDNIKHPVKIMFGNGLKPQIWKQFQQKYHIQQIYEFYACTEGNLALINLDNKQGSIGFIPPYLQRFAPLRLVKYSEITAEPTRNENGFCIKANTNEPGLAIGCIKDQKANLPSTDYLGYTNPQETKKKVLNNVFVKGDKYFNSGDVFVCDEFGYYYFVDRLGDTFRWKGENVSTNEVEAVFSNAIGFNDAIAYGVEIPGTEGKAGMVAIVHNHKPLDMDSLLQNIKRNLPSYAIPMFIRFKPSLSLTATYKLQKYELKIEGFNINIVNDIIYFYNSSLGKYVILTPEIFEEINNGKIRL